MISAGSGQQGSGDVLTDSAVLKLGRAVPCRARLRNLRAAWPVLSGEVRAVSGASPEIWEEPWRVDCKDKRPQLEDTLFFFFFTSLPDFNQIKSVRKVANIHYSIFIFLPGRDDSDGGADAKVTH